MPIAIAELAVDVLDSALFPSQDIPGSCHCLKVNASCAFALSALASARDALNEHPTVLVRQ